MNEQTRSESMVMRQVVETDGVRVVDVGPTPTAEQMDALDAEARELGAARRIAPSVYVLFPRRT